MHKRFPSVDDNGIAERDTFALLTYFDTTFFCTLFYHAKVPSCKQKKKGEAHIFYVTFPAAVPGVFVKIHNIYTLPNVQNDPILCHVYTIFIIGPGQ